MTDKSAMAGYAIKVCLLALFLGAVACATTLGACGSSSNESGPTDIDAKEPWTALDAPAWTPGIDGGPWFPSATCREQATTLTDTMTQAQWFGQMTQVDTAGLTVQEATTALLGGVFSGGSSDPAGGNTVADWTGLVTSYVDIAKTFTPRIGIVYGLDSVHGNNNLQDAVIFPHNIGLGATRNLELVERIGQITAAEMLGVGANWAFAPAVGAALDLRWGRTYESFSESPDLSGQMGAASVKGLQNGGLQSRRAVLACAKHYAGDSATDGGKNAGNVSGLDEEAFRRVAIEPYRPSIAAGVGTIMVSYSSYQGTRMTASKNWVTGVLKGEMGFQGFVTSDWDAVSELPGKWNDQVKTAINAGIDMVMLSHNYGAHSAADLAKALGALVASGEIPVDRIKDAVRRILAVKCEMGLLDRDTTIDPELTASIGSAEHRTVARDAVRQSLVLLKNDGTLPLSKTLSRIHVTGSGADSLAKQCGGWTLGWQGLGTGGAATNTTTGTTVLQAVQKLLAGTGATVTTSSDGSGAQGADRAIVVVGESSYAEGKGDNQNPTLSSADFAAIAAVKAAKVPFVVVLFSGRPLILSDSKGASALDGANAFIAAWLPGSEGDGITDVLFGSYKPTGKLSFSWPSSVGQLPIHDGDGKTPLFPYGFGLTYP